MKFLILLTLAAAACADPVLFNYPYDGVSTYVPEARAAVIPVGYQYDYPAYHVAAKAYFPAAAPVVLAADPPTFVTPEGYLADTPEVAAAKAFHFTQHAKALARN
ncbi:hypothetical protein J6590_000880 [Homalodisca vitripennis]|nr:hypothetical protein J6590_000880 [Homalodisca vitripennis]